MSPETAAIAALARRVARVPDDSNIERPDPAEAERDVAIMGGRIREFGAGVSDPTVEIRGQNEVIVAPVSALQAWFRSERGPGSLRVSLQEPDDVAKARQAVGIVSFTFSSGARIEIRRLGPVAGFFWRLRHRLGLF
jgi:hypothetical protein